MKRKLFTLNVLLFLLSYQGYSQVTLIPDANFEQVLIDLGLDTGSLDSQINTASIDTVTSLSIPPQSMIYSLDGIEDFSALEYLMCRGNNLSTLDISSNLNLEYLNCGYNGINALDVSDLSNLVYLNFEGNQLTEIDLSLNPLLGKLVGNQNFIDTLNLSQNSNLVNLYFSACNVDTIIFNSNLLLETIFCSHNDLQNFNFNEVPNLIHLGCGFNQLSELDISQTSRIRTLSCNDNLIEITNFHGADSLTFLFIDENPIDSLFLGDCTILNELRAQETNIEEIDLSLNLVLDRLWIGPNLTSIDLSNNLLITDLSLGNELTNIDLSLNDSIRHLTLSENPLTGELDLSDKSNLTSLHCGYTELEIINVKNGNNTNMNTLFANYNPNLVCLKVDSVELTIIKPFWYTGPDYSIYSTDCFLSLTENEFEFNVFPNPSHGSLYCNVSSPAEFKITNMMGQIVKEGVLYYGQNYVDVASFKNGSYIFSIRSGAIILKKMIVVDN